MGWFQPNKQPCWINFVNLSHNEEDCNINAIFLNNQVSSLNLNCLKISIKFTLKKKIVAYLCNE